MTEILDASETPTYLPERRAGNLDRFSQTKLAMGSSSTAVIRPIPIVDVTATAMKIARGVIGCAVASGRL